MYKSRQPEYPGEMSNLDSHLVGDTETYHPRKTLQKRCTKGSWLIDAAITTKISYDDLAAQAK